MPIYNREPMEKPNIIEYKAVSLHNQILVNEFIKLIKQIKYAFNNSITTQEKISNSFRLKQIQNALTIIINYPIKIQTGKQLEHMKGIGKGIINRIDEIRSTGKLSEIKENKKYDKYLNYMEELESIIGIGRRKSYELVTKYGIKSIADLKNAYKNKKIELTDGIIKGLKYHGLYQKKIPRGEMFEIDKYLQNTLKDIDPRLFGIICGSYRRQKITSNDIDFLIVHPDIKTNKDIVKKTNYLHIVIKELIKRKFIIESLTSNDVQGRYMGFCQLPKFPIRKIDIRYIPYESYYSAILYFTGSGDFNKRMRRLAINQEYLLSEYGIYKKMPDNKLKRIKVNSEKEIFDILGMEYIDPPDRI